jgi:phytoene dehydrogenase-like protein
VLERSVETTSQNLGSDRRVYYNLMTPLVDSWDELAEDLLGPPRVPRHPVAAARFGIHGLWRAKAFAEWKFKEDRTRAVFAGLAAHSFLALDRLATAAFGLMLGVMAHVVGWPIAKGGSQTIASALADCLGSLGGEIVTDCRVESLTQLSSARATLCDLTPRQVVSLVGPSFPNRFRKRLERYRYGPAAFKMDWALSSPIPWRAKECFQSATVHLGGTFAEIVASEQLVSEGGHPDRPFIILSQPTLFDSSRAPAGQHTLWAYCHVPNGSHVDMTRQIEAQIERFAPGFRDCIIARSVMTPTQLEQHNANLVGGDINGGAQDISQMFLRPTVRLYSTPMAGLYICSSSTPPGGGVHCLCGYHAARVALRKSSS